MPSDHDVLERLRTEPSPPMHLDLAVVLAEGRRRTRRRAAALTIGACAAAVAVIAVGSTVLSSTGRDALTPAVSNSTTPAVSNGTTPVVSDTSRPSPGSTTSSAVGHRTLTVGDAAYTVSVGRGLLSIDVVRGGHRQRDVAGLVGEGGAWRVVDGTDGHRVIVGVVPGRADAIELRPVAGEKVARHTVSLAKGRDFTEFVVTFAAPIDTLTPAADIGWGSSLPATSWLLGTEAQRAALAVTMAGEGAAPLAPYDLTRTGPPTGSGPSSVVISIEMHDARIGGTAVATLQADLVVKDPAGLMARLTGTDPETSVARGTFQLTDGRTFAWGVAPTGATDVSPHLDGGATAGKAVLAPMLSWTAYAVQVDGDAAQVVGVDVPLGPGRGGISVIE